MPVFYNKVQRKNPLKPADPAKWYIALRSTGMIKEKEVARLVADETTLNPKEAEMALSQLRKILIRSLLNGNTVQLGDWGSFYLTLGCEGADNPDDATPDKVRKINIRFLPGRELKDAVDKAEFRDAASLSK